MECHRQGEVAPFTLTSYDDAAAWAETIREVVQEGRMPPWFADPKYGQFINDCRMTDEEKEQINTWVDNGCPEGDAQGPARAAASLSTAGKSASPTRSSTCATSRLPIPAEGTVDYQYFTVDPGWTEDKWIQATESTSGQSLGRAPHPACSSAAKDGGEAGGRGGIGGYAPGMAPHALPTGHGHVRAGRLEAGVPDALHHQRQRSKKIAAWWASSSPIRRRSSKLVRGGVVGDTAFKIPPGRSQLSRSRPSTCS